MSKHTPGPWRFEAIDDKGTRYGAIAEPIPGQRYGARSLILSVGIKANGDLLDDYWISCTPANARLIAAAPELLEALVSLVSVFPDKPNATSAGYGKDHGRQYYLRRMPVERIETARAAIKKATEP